MKSRECLKNTALFKRKWYINFCLWSDFWFKRRIRIPLNLLFLIFVYSTAWNISPHSVLLQVAIHATVYKFTYILNDAFEIFSLNWVCYCSVFTKDIRFKRFQIFCSFNFRVTGWWFVKFPLDAFQTWFVLPFFLRNDIIKFRIFAYFRKFWFCIALTRFVGNFLHYLHLCARTNNSFTSFFGQKFNVIIFVRKTWSQKIQRNVFSTSWNRIRMEILIELKCKQTSIA